LKIICDTREQAPWTFSDQRHYVDVEVVPSSLPVGDYSIPGWEDRVAVERKSLADFVGCVTGTNRARFERELAKARSYERFWVVVEGSTENAAKGEFLSRIRPKALLATRHAWMVRYGVPILFEGTRALAEYTAYDLLAKFTREVEKRHKEMAKHQK